MTHQEINEHIATKNWKGLINKYPVKEICDKLTFESCLEFAHTVFNESKMASAKESLEGIEALLEGIDLSNRFSPSPSKEEKIPDIKNYAIEVLLEMRQRNLRQWEKSWENDFFLGNLCGSYGMRIVDQFKAYRRAIIICPKPPPSLLIAVADCRHSYPGAPSITNAEAKALLYRALNESPTESEVLMIENRLRNIEVSQQERKEYVEVFRLNKSQMQSIIDARNWEAIATTYAPETLFHNLSLEQAFVLFYSIYFNVGKDGEPQYSLMSPKLQKAALTLLLRAQSFYCVLWKKDWKNDTFLAYFCYIEKRLEQMVAACRRALRHAAAWDTKKDAIPEVLSLAACCEGFFEFGGVTNAEAVVFCKRAFGCNQSPRAAAKLHQIFLRDNYTEIAAHWEAVGKQLAEQGRKERIIIPDSLNDPKITKHLMTYLEEHVVLP